jgi:hypothetical protein
VFTGLSIFVPLALLVLAAWLINGAIRHFGAVRRFRVNAAQPETPPAYELLKRIERADGTRAVEIFRGDHGLFRFDEVKWHEPAIDDAYEYEGYWAPSMCSGLYDSADAAERDARAEIVWLRKAAND